MILPNECPKFQACSAPVCPLEKIIHTYLKGEDACWYQSLFIKGEPIPKQLQKVISEKHEQIIKEYPTIKEALETCKEPIVENEKIPISDLDDEPTDPVRAGSYNIFHTNLKGFIIGRIDKELNEAPIQRKIHGTALPKGAVDTIISQVKRGIAPEKTLSLLVAPALGHPTERNCFKLGEFVRKHAEGEVIRYAHITSGNRYAAKVDWASDKVRKKVHRLLREGKSLAKVAKNLGVSKSTLTEANKRQNYSFYLYANGTVGVPTKSGDFDWLTKERLNSLGPA